jgi:hypothetical protein
MAAYCVPTGKYWRAIDCDFHSLADDANLILWNETISNECHRLCRDSSTYQLQMIGIFLFGKQLVQFIFSQCLVD